jgi:hypothetical protein
MPMWRVVFWFDTDSEVRYVSGMPEVGDHVTHGRELWLVSRIGADAFEEYVICKRPREVSPRVSEKHHQRRLA